MKRVKVLLLVTAVFGLGMALAQSQNDHFAQWFQDAGALALVVGAGVALVRKQFLPRLEGKQVVVLSLALGAGLGAAGKALGYVEADWQGALGFGFSAGLIASGGVDLLRGMIPKNPLPEGPTPGSSSLEPKTGSSSLEPTSGQQGG